MKPVDNCLVSRAPVPGSAVDKLGLSMPDWGEHGVLGPAIKKMLDEQYEYLAKQLFEIQQTYLYADLKLAPNGDLKPTEGNWWLPVDTGSPLLHNTSIKVK